MSKTYLSQAGGAGKAHYLFKRIFEEQGAGGTPDTKLRVFAFVKDEELNSFYDDVKAFFQSSGFPVLIFPSDDVQQRTFAADKIKKLNGFILCASDISINAPVSAPDADEGITLRKNVNFKFADFISALVKIGYERVHFAEDKCQFAVRGDIVDIWPAASDTPVRVLFEYDNIDAVRAFDPGTQLSNNFIDEIKILPVKETGHGFTIKDYFKWRSEERGVKSVDEDNGLLLPAKTFEGGLSSNDGRKGVIPPEGSAVNAALLFFDYPLSKEEEKQYENGEVIINDPLNPKSQSQGYKSFTGLAGGFQGNIKYFVETVKGFAENKVKIKIYCANDGERERIADIFHESGWEGKPPEFVYGNLSQGFYLEKENLAAISSREMLYKKKPVSFPKIKGGRRLEGIWEISAGDYVVHEKYGIGRYKGLKTISRHDKTSEYLCIEYTKGDKLYVPPEEIKTVKKYIGVEGVKPKLYSMDTFAWERVKSRAREAAAEFAKELLKLYAERSKIKRTPFARETPWEKELEDAFPYDETPDQLKAIEDVKSDFLKPYPMERLVCGDVGYGKTEVAVRAAFKAVQENFQAAVLVPTTVLAQQHFNTFYNRLSPFPTRVEVLSRFQSKANQKKLIAELEQGKIDIIVGTHRLLQKDVKFKNLGILIVDEEHRFGVKQKEKIKTMKKNIDILMLSATPIPRTLSSALSGFRDLSVIETPPFGRLPIETSLSAYDEKLVKNIIQAELARNGQVFYVYNKVETILTKAEQIKKLVPDAKLGVIHGQMHAKDIENIMWKFTNMELDILIATTIIESGLDIPSVNTMIIEESENFGLSQLYQLRGRIGRDRKKAYCYLFYKDKTLSGEAVKRLEAMKEFSELGSGFRLALKDLEIRGAGGILSANQHGFVRDIGYDMFSKLLEEEGKKIKGESASKTSAKENGEIDLKVNALIPQTYIEDEDIRILFYRKLSDARNAETLDKVKEELTDRFGKLPQEVKTLFEITALRLKAREFDIERISEDNNYIYVYFSNEADFSSADIPMLIKNYSKEIEFINGKGYAFKLKKYEISVPALEYIKALLAKLGNYFKK
ncbi:MAG: transcription-repair coupling factor [Endomicrobium sp.]|jgi:transcription-repair coupling factor (superfamily II helicase)|nr:transcription-repair coupling factor [Endomicrobium sp.]